MKTATVRQIVRRWTTAGETAFGSTGPSSSRTTSSTSGSPRVGARAASTPTGRTPGSTFASMCWASSALSRRQKERVVERLGPVIRVVVDAERSQVRNRAIAGQRLSGEAGRCAAHPDRPGGDQAEQGGQGPSPRRQAHARRRQAPADPAADRRLNDRAPVIPGVAPGAVRPADEGRVDATARPIRPSRQSSSNSDSGTTRSHPFAVTSRRVPASRVHPRPDLRRTSASVGPDGRVTSLDPLDRRPSRRAPRTTRARTARRLVIEPQAGLVLLAQAEHEERRSARPCSPGPRGGSAATPGSRPPAAHPRTKRASIRSVRGRRLLVCGVRTRCMCEAVLPGGVSLADVGAAGLVGGRTISRMFDSGPVLLFTCPAWPGPW